MAQQLTSEQQENALKNLHIMRSMWSKRLIVLEQRQKKENIFPRQCEINSIMQILRNADNDLEKINNILADYGTGTLPDEEELATYINQE